VANGDAAFAAGMDVVPSIADKRLGYDEINKTRDYIAALKNAGVDPTKLTAVVPLNKGGTGAADAAGARVALGVTAINIPTSSGNVQADLLDISNRAQSALGNAAAAINGTLSADIYSRGLGANYRTLYIRNDGVIGYATSSRKFKQNIRSAEIPTEVLRAVLVKVYQTRMAVRLYGKDNAPEEMGVIAEELHDAGLHWLVDYDEKNRPFGVMYERISLIALLLAQRAWDAIDTINAGRANETDLLVKILNEIDDRITTLEGTR